MFASKIKSQHHVANKLQACIYFVAQYELQALTFHCAIYIKSRGPLQAILPLMPQGVPPLESKALVVSCDIAHQTVRLDSSVMWGYL